MWVIEWRTELTWHMVPRSRGKSGGIRMKRQPVYRRYSRQKWVPDEDVRDLQGDAESLGRC